MRLLKAEEHRRMAWKNGGGETIEVAVHPQGAGLADFDWRVSMARVEGDGPFSVFPGIDRTLCLLSGGGMELAIEGHGHHCLTTASDPLAFPADAPTVAHLPAGPITDLNVMTRRGVLRHRVERMSVEGITDLNSPAPWTLLLAAGSCRIGGTVLEPFDAILAEEPFSARVSVADGPAVLYRIEIADAV